jgi:hypothetical protein
MNKAVLLIALSCTLTATLGQSFISGFIGEEKTRNPIAYANITLSNTIGTASDEGGFFRIPVVDKGPGGIMLVSCLGYASRAFRVDSLLRFEKVNHQIYLKPSVVELPELTVHDERLTPEQLVQDAIQAIPTNYTQQPFNMEYYSRVSTKDSATVLHVVEAVSKAYRHGYKANSENFVEIREKRVTGECVLQGFDKKRNMTYFNYEILPMFDMFVVDMIGTGKKYNYTVFNPDYFARLKFRQKEVTMIDSDTVVVIEYDQKNFRKGENDTKLYGALYLSLRDLAIVKHVRRIGKNYYEVIYKKQDDHYYPYFIKTIYPVAEAKGKSALTVTHEAYVNQINTENLEVINMHNYGNKNWHLEDVKYKKDFWDKYYPLK